MKEKKLSDLVKIEDLDKVRDISILDKKTQTGKIIKGTGLKSPMKLDSYTYFVNEFIQGNIEVAVSQKDKKLLICHQGVYMITEIGNVIHISERINEATLEINAVLGYLTHYCFYDKVFKTELETICKKYKNNGFVSIIDLNALVFSLKEKCDKEKISYEVSSLISQDVFNQALKNEEYIIEGKEETKSTEKTAEKKEEFAVTPLNYDWGEEGKKRIPSISSYVPNSTYKSIVKKIDFRLNKVLKRMEEKQEDIIQNDYINIALVGSPGVGKSVTIMAAAKALGMPIYLTSGSKFTEEDQFQGTNKVAGGKLNFYPTEFLNAFKYGGVCLIEEMNLIEPGVLMGAIGQAIESPFILMEDGYKPVKRHPLCVIIGTMNTGTTGSRELNEALSSRFKQTYIMEEPKDRDFINILCSKGYPKEQCVWVFEAYKKLRDTLCSPAINRADYCMRLTTRACFGVLENIEEGCEPKEALQTLFGKIAEIDLETTKSLEYLVDMLRDPIF